MKPERGGGVSVDIIQLKIRVFIYVVTKISISFKTYESMHQPLPCPVSLSVSFVRFAADLIKM